MKTAVSLPDELLASLDALASRLGMSRSGVITAALTEYIAKHRTAKTSDCLDAVYAAEESRVDPSVVTAQRRTIRRDAEW